MRSRVPLLSHSERRRKRSSCQSFCPEILSQLEIEACPLSEMHEPGPAWEASLYQDVGESRCSGSEQQDACVSSRAQSQVRTHPSSGRSRTMLLGSAVTLVDAVHPALPFQVLSIGRIFLRVTVLSEKRSNERRCYLCPESGHHGTQITPHFIY